MLPDSVTRHSPQVQVTAQNLSTNVPCVLSCRSHLQAKGSNAEGRDTALNTSASERHWQTPKGDLKVLHEDDKEGDWTDKV